VMGRFKTLLQNRNRRRVFGRAAYDVERLVENLSQGGRTRTYPKTAAVNSEPRICSLAGSKTGSKFSVPADLQEVVDAWAELPAAITAGILAMVRASKA